MAASAMTSLRSSALDTPRQLKDYTEGADTLREKARSGERERLL